MNSRGMLYYFAPDEKWRGFEHWYIYPDIWTDTGQRDNFGIDFRNYTVDKLAWRW